MRLVNLDVFAGGLFVVGDKCGVVVFVKLPGHVVRRVQQGLRRSDTAGGQRECGQGEFDFGGHAVSR